MIFVCVGKTISPPPPSLFNNHIALDSVWTAARAGGLDADVDTVGQESVSGE